MAQPQSDPIAIIADLVKDHEKRIRRIERIVYALAGAASGGTGTWITIIMTRR